MHDIIDVIKNLQTLSENNSAFKVLKDFERVIDELDIYVFKNWEDGEIIAGPDVNRYDVKCKLMWDRSKMPDPEGGLRLTPHGTRVQFEKAQELRPEPIKDPSDYEPGTHKPRMKPHDVWLVHMCIPRRFVEAVNQDLLDQYDDEADDTETAEDQITQGAPDGQPQGAPQL